jgi:hypothetical protein
LLNYWVAQAEQQEGSARAYSTSWAEGGPVIELEQINLMCDFGRWRAMHREQMEYCRADVSPIVVPMRAYL